MRINPECKSKSECKSECKSKRKSKSKSTTHHIYTRRIIESKIREQYGSQ